MPCTLDPSMTIKSQGLSGCQLSPGHEKTRPRKAGGFGLTSSPDRVYIRVERLTVGEGPRSSDLRGRTGVPLVRLPLAPIVSAATAQGTSVSWLCEETSIMRPFLFAKTRRSRTSVVVVVLILLGNYSTYVR